MRRFPILILLSLTPIALSGCASNHATPTTAANPASVALRYSATMRSGTGAQLRESSCGAYAVVYHDITDAKLGLLREAATHKHGAFDGSTVVRSAEHGASAEVTLADTYVQDGVTSTGKHYTFILSNDSGDWKVCDTKQD